MSTTPSHDWRSRLIEDWEGIKKILSATTRVAVLGIRSEAHAARPAFYVPQYLYGAGLQVLPVPVYDLDVQQILGQPVFRRLMDIPGEVDVVNVFRRPEDMYGHLDDMLAKKPTVVWFQSGIRNDQVAERLARAGIQVVQDRCLMVDHRRYGASF